MSATLPERIFADLTQAAFADTEAMAWLASPSPGVERKPLDRDGGEVARATSVVRYAAGSRFSPHRHERGEEFLVLDGVFADEHGRYPAGTYVRNPPGSAHAPFSDEGCTILVKLRQMPTSEQNRIVVDTTTAKWEQADSVGLKTLPLYLAPDAQERVTLERLEPGARLGGADCTDGEEIFILSGDLSDEHGTYKAGTWIRNPAGFRRGFESKGGATYWAKRGHLRPTP